MSTYLRPPRPRRDIFFTVNVADRSSDLLVGEIDFLREAVQKTRAERPFHIDAWVVLPDHLHCIWTLPEGDTDYSTRWGAIKARFTMSVVEKYAQPRRPGFSPARPSPLPAVLPAVRAGRYAGLKPGLRVAKREKPIWQRRFWEHHIRSEADYAMHLRYCWLNPVKHGLVLRAEDWPYSSVHSDPRFAPGVVPAP